VRKVYSFIFIVMFLTGCAAPKFHVESIDGYDKLMPITIVRDDATRGIFLSTMETWCLDKGVDCSIVPDGTKHIDDDLTLDYVSRWSWDVTTYISDSTIKAYKNKKRVGTVTFNAPDSLDFDKFGDDDKRIDMMMKLLFGEITEAEANKKLSSGEL